MICIVAVQVIPCLVVDTVSISGRIGIRKEIYLRVVDVDAFHWRLTPAVAEFSQPFCTIPPAKEDYGGQYEDGCAGISDEGGQNHESTHPNVRKSFVIWFLNVARFEKDAHAG